MTERQAGASVGLTAWRSNLSGAAQIFDIWLKSRAPTSAEALKRIHLDALRWERILVDQPNAGERADIVRQAHANLHFCAEILGEPPPPALVRLLGLLLGVKAKRNRLKNRPMFMAAAKVKAANPAATASLIRRKLGKERTTIKQIKAWMVNPEFQAAVSSLENNAKEYLRMKNMASGK
jgi:hypothetical protein